MAQKAFNPIPVSDFNPEDIGSVMEPAKKPIEVPDYLKGNKGYIVNPLNPNAKTTGAIKVRDENGQTYSLNIDPKSPVPVATLIAKAVQNDPRNQMSVMQNIRKASSYGPLGAIPYDFASGVAGAAGNAATGLYRALTDPGTESDKIGGVQLPYVPTVLKRILAGPQVAQYQKAKDAETSGNTSEMVGHSLAAGIPILGPMAASIGEHAGTGDIAGAAGEAAFDFAPAALAKVKGIPVSPELVTKNPAEASAVRYGMKEGLPVDAATATGNPAVRGLQWLADKSIGGSFVNASSKVEGAAKMSGKLDTLANKGGTAIHPEQAGASVKAALESKIASQHGIANQEYSALRTIEADPKNLVRVQTGTKPAPLSLSTMGIGPRGTVPVYEDIPLPVDTSATKAALAPILDQMKRQMPETIRQASPGYKALENIVNGPDFASATQVDRDLSAIKAIERTSDSKYLRDVSQGLAAKSVNALSSAVDTAVARGGQKAVDALQRGREATRTKYEVADVLDSMRDEPVQAFNQMVYSKDAGINQLRDVAKHAPNEMPKVGSAFLNDILDTSTAEGGFDKAAGAWAKWDKLGTETKKVLFKDPKYIKDLDDFFLLSKKLADNPNPSGTAVIGQTGLMVGAASSGHLAATAVSALSLAALSKILHSPHAVNLMVNGLKVSGKVPAAAITAGNLAATLDSNTKKLEVPDNIPKGKK
jgi:hypothetical protein